MISYVKKSKTSKCVFKKKMADQVVPAVNTSKVEVLSTGAKVSIALIVIIVLGIGIGLGVYFLTQKSKSNDDVTDTTGGDDDGVPDTDDDVITTVTYTPNVFVETKNTAMVSVTPTTTGGTVVSWSVDQPCQAGFLLTHPLVKSVVHQQ